MQDSDLRALLGAKIQNSVGYLGGKLSQDRQKADSYYRGDPFGNELEGRSQVVSRDVAEAVDAMMPSLMKIFASGDEAVKFEPTAPEDEASAKAATDYINWIWYQQNAGYLVFFTWFKDSLLKKNSVIKIWWDASVHHDREEYEGLTQAEYDQLCADPDRELKEHTEYPDPAGAPSTAVAGGAGGSPPGPPGAPLPAMQPTDSGQPVGSMSAPAYPGAMAPTPMLHDAVFMRTHDESQVRVAAVPGDEFLIDRRAVDLDEVTFTAHRVRKTASELKIEYPGKGALIETLVSNDGLEWSQERINRFYPEDEFPYRSGDPYDPSTRPIWVSECYVRVDYDGDGIAELRKVTLAATTDEGGEILDNEEVDDNPFASLTPIPMPHKFYGMSIADQIEDIQLVKSTLVRQMLDSMYLSLNPQKIAVEGQVNLDDLLTSRPGGVVRAKSIEAVREVLTTPVAAEAFQALSYFDAVREGRTGVQRFASGPGAENINDAYTQTATGLNAVQTSSQERLDLIARNFAETGVKRAFRRIFELVCKHQDKPRKIKLRDQWTEINPAEWNERMDMTVHVGLGTGNKMQQIGAVTNILNIQKEIVMSQGGYGGLVIPKNVYNACDKLIEATGLKSATPYFSDPDQTPPAQPKPDPKMQQIQMQAQIAQQKAQTDQQAAQQDMQLKQAQAQMDAQNEHQKTQAELAKAMMEMRLEMQRFQMEMGMRRQEFAMQAQHDQAAAHIDLATQAAASDQKLTQQAAQAEQAQQIAQQKAKMQPKGPAK